MTDTELKGAIIEGNTITGVPADAGIILTDIKSEITKLGADEAKTVGYVKTHMLYIVGAVCLLIGFIAGHVLK